MSQRPLPPVIDFNSVTIQEARVLIAKDVLQRLRYRKTNVLKYLHLTSDLAYADNNDDARCHIRELEKCQACALGNMLISHIRVFDNLTMGQIESGRSGTINPLRKYFDMSQLDLIECAFEGRMIGMHNVDYPARYLAKKYYEKFQNPTKRLRAIMLNVVKNKGEFIPVELK